MYLRATWWLHVYPELIRAKFQRPYTRSDLIARPHLLSLLSQFRESKLLLISAPAGFGKTTLICSWLLDNDCPVAWLSLDEDDNDLGVFVGYVLGAIRTIFPSACSRTLGLLKAPHTPPPEHLATTFSNEMSELSGSSTVEDFLFHKYDQWFLI